MEANAYMWSVLATSWRVVVRRAIADRVILMAAVITILLATMLVASGPIYSDAVSLSAARRTLADAPVQDANLVVFARVLPRDLAAMEERADAEIRRAFALTGGTVYRRGTSDSYALPDQPGETVTDLAIFRTFEQIEDHATIVEGQWPAPGNAPYEVAIPDSVSVTLGYGVGDELELTNRRDAAVRVPVRIVGIYSVDDALDPYWYGDEIDINGVEIGSSFTTYGPLVVPPETLFGPVSPFSAEVEWRVFPNHDNLTVSEISPLRRAVEQLEGRVNAGRSSSNRARVETGLVQILRDTERSLLVTRSSVLILTIQLAVLAGYALLLTAGLLAESRQIETNLLRSRGAASSQILSMALMEGLLLTVPAALVAPWLATLVLRAMNVVGPLAEIELAINPVVTRPSYIVAGLAALGCLIALALPAYRSAQQFGDVRAQRARETPRGLVQRAGIDIALLLVAGIGFWQLRRFGAPITETVQGRLGIDPLLVAAPALGLLAGGVVALRTLPMISRLAESVTARSTLLVPALGAWQVARRPLRYARAALLLMLATGIGLFSVAYATTWRTSQDDQAAHQIGADLRVEPDRRIGTAIPPHVLRDAYDDLPGFVEVMPVQREFGRLSRSGSSGRYVILDAARAGQTVYFRDDLAEQPLDAMLARLVEERIQPHAIELPGEPERIAVDVTFETAPLPDDFVPPEDVRPSRLELTPTFRVVLVDGDGLYFRLELGTLEQTGERMRLVGDIGYSLSDGERLSPTYPVSLAAFELRTGAPQDIVREARLEISGALVSPDVEGDNWQPVGLDLAPAAWDASVTDLALAIERPEFELAEDAGGLVMNLSSGSTTAETAMPVVFAFEPAGRVRVDTLPVLVSSQLMEEGNLEIGDQLPLPSLPSFEGFGRVVGVIDEFPTVERSRGEPIIIDFQSLSAASFTPGALTQRPDEYWFALEQEFEDAAIARLTDAPILSSRVFSRAERELTLNSDPVALGTIGSLMFGFVAAAIFAGIGFAVNAAVSARERLVEFALMRAVGLSNRQLLAWLSLENAMLVLFGLIGGTLLGVLLSWVVLPLISITQEATEAVPGVVVVYPWLTIFWLELSIIAVLVAAVVMLAVMLRRMGLGTLLRIGEE